MSTRTSRSSDCVRDGCCDAADTGGGPAGQQPEARCADVNVLTAAERSAGWQLLFDGTSTAGWHGYNKQDTQGVGDRGLLAEDHLAPRATTAATSAPTW